MVTIYSLAGGHGVVRDDGAFVPNDLANRDWIEYQAWLAAGNTPDPYVPPPASVPQIISDRQFYQQLAAMGVITRDEARAAIGPGTLPSAFAALIADLPTDQQFSAEMLLIGAIQFDRSHPMVAVLGAAEGWSSAQIDDLWRTAAAL